MKIYIGADHRGFNLKEKVKKWLTESGYEFEDMGAHEPDPKDDYTLYAQKVASAVSSNKETFGVLICGSGIGVEVVANKFDNVRAGLGKSVEQVKMGRNDDDMNVLVLAADFTVENEARDMLKAFLSTRFEGAERFKRRLNHIKEIETSR